MVSIERSRVHYTEMRGKGIACEMLGIPGEAHTFCGNMKVGNETWKLQMERA